VKSGEVSVSKCFKLSGKKCGLIPRRNSRAKLSVVF